MLFRSPPRHFGTLKNIPKKNVCNDCHTIQVKEDDEGSEVEVDEGGDFSFSDYEEERSEMGESN